MRRQVRIILLLVLVAVSAIQFIQPDRNADLEEPGNDLLTVLTVPDSVAALLKNSCYDCHSGNTVYPWYSRISPLSWFLQGHINRGKEELNFSAFGQLEKRKQIGSLSEICEVLESGAMPLKSYLLIHRDARLDPIQIASLCDWSGKEAGRLMKE